MSGDFDHHETNGFDQPATTSEHGSGDDPVDERDLIDDETWKTMLRRAFGTAGRLDEEN